MPGRIGKIRIEGADDPTRTAGRIASFQNEFPLSDGQIFNLRALEQGLENLKRLPTAEADIRIEPGEAPGTSDVVVLWQQQLLPYRFSLGADDAGS